MPDRKDHLYGPALMDAGDHLHWSRLKNLMLVMLGLWLTYFLVVQGFITRLNRITVPVIEFPLGICLATQGALVLLAAMLVRFARKPELH